MTHMRRSAIALIPLGIATAAYAKEMFEPNVPSFALAGRPIGGANPGSPTAAYLAGSRIAALPDGALVIDADSGKLIRTDRDGKHVAELAIGANAGLLAYDPIDKRAFVADRTGNRVAIVSIGERGA